MTRWGTGVRCPNRCGGKIEVWFEGFDEKNRPVYLFCCSHCDVRGNWEQVGRRLARGIR